MGRLGSSGGLAPNRLLLGSSLAGEIDDDGPVLALHVVDRQRIAIASLELAEQGQRVVVVAEAHRFTDNQGIKGAEYCRMAKTLGDAAGIEGIDLSLIHI